MIIRSTTVSVHRKYYALENLFLMYFLVTPTSFPLRCCMSISLSSSRAVGKHTHLLKGRSLVVDNANQRFHSSNQMAKLFLSLPLVPLLPLSHLGQTLRGTSRASPWMSQEWRRNHCHTWKACYVGHLVADNCCPLRRVTHWIWGRTGKSRKNQWPSNFEFLRK